MNRCLWAGLTLGLVAGVAGAAEDNKIVVFPEKHSVVRVLKGGDPYLEIGFVGWAKNWKHIGWEGTVQAQDGATVLTCKGGSPEFPARLSLVSRLRKEGPKRLIFDIQVETSADIDLTYIVSTLTLTHPQFRSGKVQVQYADGTTKEVSLPLERKGLGKAVKEYTVVDESGAVGLHVSLQPPCDIASDGAARVVLADKTFKASAPVAVKMAVDFSEPLTYYSNTSSIPFEPGFAEWFTFQPDTDYEKPSEIGMQDWFETPAGRHGRILRKDDQLLYNGKPIKLWGVNLCYTACAPPKELAEKRAKFYRKFGINSVRLHKYAEGAHAVVSADSFAKFDPDALDRMDYFIAKLKEQGIYVEFSSVFGPTPLGPADKETVPYMNEFGSGSKKGSVKLPPSTVYYSPEIQSVHIAHTVNLLKHKNPHTGLTYAEDPAIAFIEIVNEHSILFYSAMAPLKASETLRRQVGKRFCDWLRQKYGTQEKLLAAWGERTFDGFEKEGLPKVEERLDQNNILPIGQPWFWDPAQLNGSQAFRKQRLLDSMMFLYGLQNEFYDRFVKAARAAGYRGELTGSNWQAGRACSHLLNLHSDMLVGTVDRHNYFGGGGDTRINSVTMLRIPGSGMLSSGMQQVGNHPFMLSEWIHVTPNEWGMEGPAIIGAYAMGLQGWDVSYMFNNSDDGAFSSRIGRGGQWDITAPQVLGVFPAVARQVLRGDVIESKLVVPRYAHVPSLGEGRISYEDRVEQDYDVKSFSSDKVPAQALSVARCVVEYTDTYRDTPVFDLTPYIKDGWYTATTGQLRWRPGREKLDGCFTINSDSTKAVVGFAQGQTCQLGSVTIRPQSPFAAIYITAKEPDKTLETSRNLLIVAIARARNTGMKVFNNDTILDHGKAPVVLEPVKAEIRLQKTGQATLHILDHNGRKTGKTLPVKDGVVDLNGARDKTCYYLISFAN